MVRSLSMAPKTHDWRLVIVASMVLLAALATGSAITAGDQAAGAEKARTVCAVYERADAIARTDLDAAQRHGVTEEAHRDIDRAMAALVQAMGSRSCFPAVTGVRAN